VAAQERVRGHREARLDAPREACGVVGIHAPGGRAAAITYPALLALQHRGEEAAGMAVSDGTRLTVVKDAGLVREVFDDHRLEGLHGELAIGHVRYSTAGAGGARNAQPFRRCAGTAEFALAHNGNLINASELAGRAGLRDSRSDSQLIADLIATRLSGTCDLETAVLATLPRLQGASRS